MQKTIIMCSTLERILFSMTRKFVIIKENDKEVKKNPATKFTF